MISLGLEGKRTVCRVDSHVAVVAAEHRLGLVVEGRRYVVTDAQDDHTTTNVRQSDQAFDGILGLIADEDVVIAGFQMRGNVLGASDRRELIWYGATSVSMTSSVEGWRISGLSCRSLMDRSSHRWVWNSENSLSRAVQSSPLGPDVSV